MKISFTKLSNADLSFDVIKEFIDHYVTNSPERNGLLGQLSNLYVLILSSDEPLEFLTPQQNICVQKHGHYIAGFILLSEMTLVHQDQKVHYIEYIDTRIRNHDFARQMISRYECTVDCILLPEEILSSAKGYWKKYFAAVYGLRSRQDYMLFMEKYGTEKIDWSSLLTILM